MRTRSRAELIRVVMMQVSLAGLYVCITLVVVMKDSAMSQQNADADREIVRLLQIIRDERLRTEDPDKVAQAIATLGELRATAAVEDLIKLITFKRTFPQERGNPEGVINDIHVITREGRYPAIGSLFEIGKPSLPSLVRLIANHDPKSLQSENALIAVRLIFRDESQAGVQYLKDAGEKSSSSLSRQRLLIAAERAKGPPL
jgi:hypothetical protein